MRFLQIAQRVSKKKYFYDILLMGAFLIYVHRYIDRSPYWYTTKYIRKFPQEAKVESVALNSTLKRMEEQCELQTVEFAMFIKGQSPYKASFALLASLLKPEVACEHLIRFGSKHDGGHWICNPHTITRNPCVIYSVGVDDKLSFEREFQSFASNKCSLYVFDKSNHNSETKTKIEALNGQFEKVTVEEIASRDDPRRKGLSDLFIEHSYRSIDILKVDQKENVQELVGSVAGLYDIHHIVATHSGRPEQIAIYMSTMSDLHYSLYSWEFDHRQPNTLTTSHIANRHLNASDVNLLIGHFYQIQDFMNNVY